MDSKSVVLLTAKLPLELLGTGNLRFTHKAVRNWASHLPRLEVPVPPGEGAVLGPQRVASEARRGLACPGSEHFTALVWQGLSRSQEGSSAPARCSRGGVDQRLPTRGWFVPHQLRRVLMPSCGCAPGYAEEAAKPPRSLLGRAGGQSSGTRGPAAPASGSREVSRGFLVRMASPKQDSALLYGTMSRLRSRTNGFSRYHKLSYVRQPVALQKILSYMRNQTPNLVIPGRIPPVKWPEITK